MTVEIPESFVMRLQGLGPHFIRVSKHGKEPIDKGWTLNPMFANDPKLQNWLKEGGNYGVVGGFGLVIVDVDLEELKQIVRGKLPKTFKIQSPGSHGWHLYYLCSLEKPIRLRDKDGENVGDIQGQGKMVVGPRSIHPNGGAYQVIADRALAQVTREQLIEAFKEFVVPDREIERVEATARMERNESKINLGILQVVPSTGLHQQGLEYYGSHPVHGSNTGRNFWVNPSKNCWHCFRHGSGGGPLLWLAVKEGIIDCAEAGPGALRGEVFKQVLMKARERGYINDLVAEPEKIELQAKSCGRKPSQADMLVLLCLAQEPELFHDQHKTPYARIKQNNVNVTLPIRSRPFKAWLANLLWQAAEKAPGTEALYGAINILEAKALFDGKEYVLYNRVAPTEDGFWIDLADDKWRAIKVTGEGWRIIDDPPILFRRYSHQKPLVEPKPGGDSWVFLKFVNVDEEDKNTRLLLLCAIISYLIPMIPHVILVLYGIQGSGKTCLFKVVRRLIDPSVVEVLTLPRDERERVQQLDHHWCAFYDNVTRLPTWMSDTLCRAATGGGFTKRELYTNDQDIIYNFKRCVGLNGINIAAQRGDLLDRSLLVGLQDIPKDRRKTEEQLLDEFESHKAEILGGFLDVLVKAIRLYPTVNPKELFRMADFTRWGCAIAVALGYKEEDFINAYEAKVKAQIEEAAHASPLATVLIDYVENHKKWEGTPSQLYRILIDHAKEVGISTRQKAWPKAPHILVRKLNELIPSLKELGIEVTTGIRTGSARRIIVNTVTNVTSDMATGDDGDASDASRLTSSRLVGDVKELVRLTATTQGECVLCGVRGRMDWQVTKHNGEWGLLCSDCGFELQEQLGEGKIEGFFSNQQAARRSRLD